MVWKKVLKSVAKILINLAFKTLFNALDRNKDGKVSKKELNLFLKDIKQWIRYIKSR